MAHPVIRAMIVITGVASLLGISFLTLIPAWAKDILGGDVRTNGWLHASRGVGAMPLGSLAIGHLAGLLGAPATVLIAGGAGLLFGGWLLIADPALRKME